MVLPEGWGSSCYGMTQRHYVFILRLFPCYSIRRCALLRTLLALSHHAVKLTHAYLYFQLARTVLLTPLRLVTGTHNQDYIK